ncbi:BTAD domain-containing putative transcriptional regulator [Virgibacillus siamensis]|uniref:BTAD domain-containing putative transcriptional regulator n=1 Tax=Virgibacillus siamensis TaxID=480071 RepID=UPI0009863D34|nr:BTAD domain-containing putative transcriptional regulator [Virgibacillus siamensis]
MGKIPIIHSQLSPPPMRDRFVRRVKVNRKLHHAAEYPLTIVHAGAGYGKSTALAAYVRDADMDICWYSISRNDDDILPFINNLTHAVKQKYPVFGKTILDELEGLDNHINTEQIWLLASSFINEILQLKKPVTLILDDFHHVKNSYEIEQWTKLLLEHVPENLHIILSGRNRPKWDVIPKLKVKGDLLDIDQNDLVLSAEEMDHVLKDIYGVYLSPEDLRRIHQLTEGWAIAFSMFAQHIQSKSSIHTILENRQKSLQDLFDYLAAEVLSKQSLIIQQFLLQSSIIDVLTADICDDVLEINGSEEILAGLVEQNLFIIDGEGNHFRYHALFKTFLENQLKENHPHEFKKLHTYAAQYYKKIFHLETALFHYRKIHEYGAIAQILIEHGKKMLRTGRLQYLYELLAELPEAYKEKNRILYFYQGEIERYHSAYADAEKNFDRILKSYQKDYYLAGLALEGKTRIYLDTIQPDKAERYVSQAIQMREQSGAPGEEMAHLFQLMAENLINSGQAMKAETWFDREKELNLPLEEGNLQARIYLRTGRLLKAKELLIRRKQTVQSTKHLPQSHRETDILLSIIEAFMGEAESSKKLASDGIQLGLKIQSPFVEACGWMRMGHAVQMLDHYDTELAVECYETALNIMEKINVSRGKAEPYMGLSVLYGKKQMHQQAVEMSEKGLQETEKVNDRWLSSIIRLGLGITQVYNNSFIDALETMAETLEEFKSCGDRYGMIVSRFWFAYIAFKQGKEKVFMDEMGIFLREVQMHAYDFFLKKRTMFGPSDVQNVAPMLLKAKELDIEATFVSRTLHELGFNETIKSHPGYTLSIQTFGHLEVSLGEKQLESSDWQRGKAKELFEYFITNRKTLMPKEEIFHALWPDQDEDSANKLFKVTFNALLKALEPDRKPRQESFFIQRNGSSYGLNADSGYKLDCVMFEKGVLSGIEESDPKHAKELLERTLALYQGSYLADVRYADWCMTERERLQLIYLRGCEKMAQVTIRLHEFNACIEWCEKILKLDPAWEEAYRLLMYSYYQNNNRPQAIRWYEKCAVMLDRELGIEPMEPTKELYEMIIKSEDLNTIN